MRTIEITLYKFSELSNEAKRKALDKFEPFIDYINQEAHKTEKAFVDIFGINGNHRTYWVDNHFAELRGVRLRTYIINNFYSNIFTPKIYYYKGKKRISNIFKEVNCPLTGVFYDHSILEPLLNFLVKPTDICFDDIISQCMAELERDMNYETEYRYSDKSKIEEIEGNEYEFTESGEFHIGV